jgi:transposase InsO family protein
MLVSVESPLIVLGHDRIRAMQIKEVVTAARSPWQNAYVERIIGSIRRECLNHVIIFNEHHLRGVLFHKTRTHLSLDKDCSRDPARTPTRCRQDHRVLTGRRTTSLL